MAGKDELYLVGKVVENGTIRFKDYPERHNLRYVEGIKSLIATAEKHPGNEYALIGCGRGSSVKDATATWSVEPEKTLSEERCEHVASTIRDSFHEQATLEDNVVILRIPSNINGSPNTYKITVDPIQVFS